METTNTTTPVEKTRKCRICGKELPLEAFDSFGKRGYHTACRNCEASQNGEQNPKFKDFTSRELILELRARGYRGELQQVTINKVVI